jgi:hypothetical protein
VAEANLDELEKRVNEIVYDMFGITPDEQDLVEEYLDTFRVY